MSNFKKLLDFFIVSVAAGTASCNLYQKCYNYDRDRTSTSRLSRYILTNHSAEYSSMMKRKARDLGQSSLIGFVKKAKIEVKLSEKRQLALLVACGEMSCL